MLNDDDIYGVKRRQKMDRELAHLQEEAEFVRMHLALFHPASGNKNAATGGGGDGGGGPLADPTGAS